MNILKVVFVIIGTLIGAGFASGQEMYLFFYSYGIEGLIGILISSILMGIVIYKVLVKVKKHNIETYKDLLETFFKIKTKDKFLNLENVINIVINIFILITFFIMIAGFGAYFSQELGIDSLIGSSVLALISFIIFKSSTKGVVKASEILVPMLILIVAIIGIINLKQIDILRLEQYATKTNNSNFAISGIIYCSYNSILLIPVLITLKEYITSKKQILGISIITTVITIILSVLIFMLLVKVDVDIKKLEMPVVYVASHMSKMFGLLYGFVILTSIFTTTISLGNGFLQNTSKNEKSYTQIALIMCITSVIISKIGFSNLISSLYPIFGYLGIIQILLLFK